MKELSIREYYSKMNDLQGQLEEIVEEIARENSDWVCDHEIDMGLRILRVCQEMCIAAYSIAVDGGWEAEDKTKEVDGIWKECAESWNKYIETKFKEKVNRAPWAW